jgi:hypothetical protein
MRTLGRGGCVAAALAFILVAAEARADWSLPSGYSVARNPNDAWCWGQTSATGSLGTFEPFTLLTSLNGYPTVPLWIMPGHPAQDNACSFINTYSYVFLGTNPGQVAIHPGPDLHQAVMRWTSPISGLISITGAFGAGDHSTGNQGNVDVRVIRTDGSGHVTATLFTVLDTPSTQNFNLSTTVTAGNTIDFVVGNAGNWYYDSTPLDATITPEPATLTLLALGGAAVVARRRRA